MTIEFSRRLAIVLGTLLPAIEIVRRWHQLTELSLLWVWFDDVIVSQNSADAWPARELRRWSRLAPP